MNRIIILILIFFIMVSIATIINVYLTSKILSIRLNYLSLLKISTKLLINKSYLYELFISNDSSEYFRLIENKIKEHFNK